jgi:ribosomal protein S18 acetylase RimI-like enzyme
MPIRIIRHDGKTDAGAHVELDYREMQLPTSYSRLDTEDFAREVRSRALLTRWGVELPSSPVDLLSGRMKAWQCTADSQLVGHCAADSMTGRIVSLGVSAGYEGRGIGKKLLSLTVASLRAAGATRIWLAATPDPTTRAHGFYRAAGWRPTGEKTENGEEILELPDSIASPDE